MASSNTPSTHIIGISGPSSSGKTTLTRLLQRIFARVDLSSETSQDLLSTFIVHEDDFYKSDDRIPYTKTHTGKTIQDWDCAAAIDIPFLAASLSYIQANGCLPPRLKSKEDLNDASESGVPDDVVEKLRRDVHRRLLDLSSSSSSSSGGGSKSESESESAKKKTVLAFLEGFLLYSPPPPQAVPGKEGGKEHILRSVHDNISLRLFLPAAYDDVKTRRENRSGYVTIGPQPDPPSSVAQNQDQDQDNKESQDATEAAGGIDLEAEAEDNSAPQHFWTDPPGYVDDIVWPRYVQDHAWLLLPEGESGGEYSVEELLRRVGQGVNVRGDAGVLVAPGNGTKPMVDVLEWAVEEVMGFLESKSKM